MNTAHITMSARIKELLDDYKGMFAPRNPAEAEHAIRSAWHLHRAIEELEEK